MNPKIILTGLTTVALLSSCNKKVTETVSRREETSAQAHTVVTADNSVVNRKNLNVIIENPCIRLHRIRADDTLTLCVTGSRLKLVDTGAMTKRSLLKLTADDSLVTAASLDSRSQKVTKSDSFSRLLPLVASAAAAILATIILSLTRIRSRR